MSSVARALSGWSCLVVLVMCGCGDDPPPIDAAIADAAADAIADAPIDARVDAPVDAMVDAAVDAPPPPLACDPVTAPGQSGCPVGERCTWIVLADVPAPLGTVGCAPTGPVPLGGACTIGAPGVVTGHDDCGDGALCINGTCQDVCGFDGAADAACSAGNSCTRYAGIFSNGADEAVAGICRPGCDPLAPGACPAGQGCYVLVNNTTTTAVCAAAGTIGQGQPIVGSAFANSCLPGYQPRRRSGAGTEIECGGLCRPASVTSTQNQASEGGVAPSTCVAGGAAGPADPVNGESCRYWWAREPFDALSPYSNAVGWCFAHARFSFDSDGDMTPDAPFPRCTAVSGADKVPPLANPPASDAIYFWCHALPAMLRTSVAEVKRSLAAREPRLDRLVPRR